MEKLNNLPKLFRGQTVEWGFEPVQSGPTNAAYRNTCFWKLYYIEIWRLNIPLLIKFRCKRELVAIRLKFNVHFRFRGKIKSFNWGIISIITIPKWLINYCFPGKALEITLNSVFIPFLYHFILFRNLTCLVTSERKLLSRTEYDQWEEFSEAHRWPLHLRAISQQVGSSCKNNWMCIESKMLKHWVDEKNKRRIGVQ